MEFEKLVKNLRKFSDLLKKTLILLVPSFSEDGFQSQPKKALHDDYMEILLSSEGMFFGNFFRVNQYHFIPLIEFNKRKQKIEYSIRRKPMSIFGFRKELFDHFQQPNHQGG